MVDDEEDHETLKKNNDCEECKSKDIWEDELNMMVWNGSQFPTKCGEEDKSKVNKRILHYYWNNEHLMFKDWWFQDLKNDGKLLWICTMKLATFGKEELWLK